MGAFGALGVTKSESPPGERLNVLNSNSGLFKDLEFFTEDEYSATGLIPLMLLDEEEEEEEEEDDDETNDVDEKATDCVFKLPLGRLV